MYQQGANPKVVCLHSIERKAPAGKLQAPHYRLQGKCPTTNTPFGPLALAILFVCEDAQDAVVIWPVARFRAIALFEGSV